MAENGSGYVREVAHRVFAAELKESNLQSKEGQDQYSPQYLITPTGAKCNRVFIVGTLTEKEDVGTDSEFWRGRIVDPTGVFYVTAGQYQPEAAQVLARTAPPEFIAVIGKPTIFTTKEGNVLTSIRAESMHVVDAATRDRWCRMRVISTNGCASVFNCRPFGNSRSIKSRINPACASELCR